MSNSDSVQANAHYGIPKGAKLALLMHDYLTSGYGKMGHGLLRYSEQRIVAVVDRTHVGRDLFEAIGIHRDTPIVANVEDAARLGADTLVIGVATAGGVLPEDYWDEMIAGLHRGMSLVNGLHEPLSDNPRLTAAKQEGRFIWDVRKEPPNLSTGTGAAWTLPVRRVLTVGTDMAIGKMTTAIEIDRAAHRSGIRSEFLATGQIGICIAGDGVPVDAVRVDFASGAVEQLVMRHAEGRDILCIEGQGSILHPASTAWLPLIRGACPTHMILCHRAHQTTLARDEGITIPPLQYVAALYEAVGYAAGAFPPARVVGIALDTSHMNEITAHDAIDEVKNATNLPVTDVVRYGAERLLDAIL